MASPTVGGGAGDDRKVFEVLLDRASYQSLPGSTLSGVMFKTQPTPQSGVAVRYGWTADPTKPWTFDFTGGLRVAGLSGVETVGTKAGIAIQTGNQFSGLFGVILRKNGPYEFGIGLEGRLSSLVTQLDGGKSSRKLVVTPWLRTFVTVWEGRQGRYLRLEGGFNPLNRTFESRTYENSRWAPWADASTSPAKITTSAYWEPKWYVGLAIGSRPTRPTLSRPAPEMAPPPPMEALEPVVVPVSEDVQVVAVSKPARKVDANQPVVIRVQDGSLNVEPFRIYFRAGKADLTHESIVILSTWSKGLPEDGRWQISLRVEGCADLRGNAKRNKALSLKRAEATAKYLTKLGFVRETMEVVDRGGQLHKGKATPTEALAMSRSVVGSIRK